MHSRALCRGSGHSLLLNLLQQRVIELFGSLPRIRERVVDTTSAPQRDDKVTQQRVDILIRAAGLLHSVRDIENAGGRAVSALLQAKFGEAERNRTAGRIGERGVAHGVNFVDHGRRIHAEVPGSRLGGLGEKRVKLERKEKVLLESLPIAGAARKSSEVEGHPRSNPPTELSDRGRREHGLAGFDARLCGLPFVDCVHHAAQSQDFVVGFEFGKFGQPVGEPGVGARIAILKHGGEVEREPPDEWIVWRKFKRRLHEHLGIAQHAKKDDFALQNYARSSREAARKSVAHHLAQLGGWFLQAGGRGGAMRGYGRGDDRGDDRGGRGRSCGRVLFGLSGEGAPVATKEGDPRGGGQHGGKRERRGKSDRTQWTHGVPSSAQGRPGDERRWRALAQGTLAQKPAGSFAAAAASVR